MASTTSSIRELSGYMPAVPTPFTTGDTVDFAAFARFCDLQIEAGATALVVLGTTGEAPTLGIDEQRQLILAARRIASRRVPVVAGAGSNSTAHAIELSRMATAAGADALLSVVPYYNKPPQAGIHAHFLAIAKATDLPIILYDVPSRTVSALADDTVARLAENPRFAGLKDATGDVSRPLRLRRLVGSDFRLLSGDDATAPAFLAQGGDGCISVTSNVAPQLCRDMYLALVRGDLAEAHRLSIPLSILTAALFRKTSPIPLKQALSLLGLMSAAVRLPLVQLSEQGRDELVAVIQQVSVNRQLIGEVAARFSVADSRRLTA
ncbi:4-hydroxy-tetrahydrodipicolinate synthase [Bradyrhizobium sp. LHD-71]|uniref:4-hydroxy-tetrahydrodipicolinate synthase n=1 Tax=Bradyrhizobium sp. LHD-71 TaxID=3072141 RepID=UPI00280EA2D6|nr:4-hydroxy-tetrahydrodipicolinate synthase [Bradyrhizobium sp. LHD-71]MDQ8727714.1 4-hydroxy-tetrahydrodipicolinate synthase [Bradyrhizobium sp. LHD-71]